MATKTGLDQKTLYNHLKLENPDVKQRFKPGKLIYNVLRASHVGPTPETKIEILDDDTMKAYIDKLNNKKIPISLIDSNGKVHSFETIANAGRKIGYSVAYLRERFRNKSIKKFKAKNWLVDNKILIN